MTSLIVPDHDDHDRAEALLARATSVVPVGPRPWSDRGVSKLLRVLNISVGVALGLTIGHAASVVSHPADVAVVSPTMPVVWVDNAAPTPWWVASLDERGMFSTKSFQQVCQDRDLTQQGCARVMVALLAAEGSVVVGRGGGSVLEDVRERQRSMRQWLEQAWEDPSLVAKPYPDPSVRLPAYDDVERLWWMSVGQPLQIRDGSFGNDHQLDVPVVSMSLEDARAEMEHVVAQTGLAALYVPASWSQDPVLLHQATVRLASANGELANATGLDSEGLLGLHGRVRLHLTNVGNGTTSLAPDGSVEIHATWPTLAHEWFHAWDFAQRGSFWLINRRQTLSHNMSLSSAWSWGQDVWTWRAHDQGQPLAGAMMTLWQGLNAPLLDAHQRQQILMDIQHHGRAWEDNKPIFLAMRGVLEDLQQHKLGVASQGSPWLVWRANAADRLTDSWPDAVLHWAGHDSDDLGSDYLRSSTEIFAYSFTMFVQQRLDGITVRMNNHSLSGHALTSDVVSDASHGQAFPSYQPSSIEAAATVETWRSYFAKTAPWWQDDCRVRLYVCAHDEGMGAKAVGKERLQAQRDSGHQRRQLAVTRLL